MKDIFIENGERKFKLVPNIAVDSLGQETVDNVIYIRTGYTNYNDWISAEDEEEE